ncbi:MAG: tRNA uridine-5-carboxymethylaminomethyl(34) synthesis GTPase MnmE, partial [Pseudomonadota bacterium]
GVAGVAVIRVSGPAARDALGALVGERLPEPGRLVRRRLRGATGEVLDEAMVVRFAAPRSYTGDDVVELHCHGSRAVVSAVLAELASMTGLSVAEPGAFTRRAFENGKLDLTEVEALGDLLAAETEAQRRFAISGVSGSLRRRAETWRREGLDALALVEATIDWADEEIPQDVSPEVDRILSGLREDMQDALRGSGAAERLRHGFEIALVGAPNAGKSSLFNALVGRDAAITSSMEGTTRDVISADLVVEGIPVTLLDMAGLRSGGDEIERIGVERAQARARAADIRVFLEAPDATLPSEVMELWQEADLRVATKDDLGAEGAGEGLRVSSLTGAGLRELVDALAAILSARTAGAGVIGHARQREAVERAVARLRAARRKGAAELMAEELRGMLHAVGELTGQFGAEEVLDRVFGRFCVGK